MSTDTAVREFAAPIQDLGDKIVKLTLLEAKDLSDYLETKYGIKAAAGGAVMMAGPMPGADAGPAAPAAKTEFDVVLESFGEKKLDVIKEIRKILTGLSLGDAKALVEGAPAKVKEGIAKEEADKIKTQLEAVGAKIAIK